MAKLFTNNNSVECPEYVKSEVYGNTTIIGNCQGRIELRFKKAFKSMIL